MSNEQQVLALIEQGNPVPDPDAIEMLPAQPAEYLATLQQRSSDVVQLEERTEVKDKKRNWMIAAAAVFVVVLGAAVFILTQSSEEPPPATQPPVQTGTIEGYWSGEEADFFFGESEYAIVIDGALSDSGTYETGIRESDNRIVTLTSGAETVDCTPGDVAILNYDFVLGGEIVQLSGTPTDECGLRPLLDIEMLAPTDPFEIPGPAAAISPDFAGTWSNSTTAIVFDEATYFIIQNNVLVDEGSYELEGEPAMVTFISSAGSAGCAPGSTGQMMVTSDNGLTLVATADQCLVRSFLSAQGPALALEPAADIDPQLLETEIDVAGEWVDGTVEVVFSGGTYELRIDGAVVDGGSYQLTSGPYRLELDSSSGDPNCSSATYEIALEGGENLTLRPATEQCPARSAFSDVFLSRDGGGG